MKEALSMVLRAAGGGARGACGTWESELAVLRERLPRAGVLGTTAQVVLHVTLILPSDLCDKHNFLNIEERLRLT